MNCRVVQKLLHLYLDSTLSPADTRTVEDHVAACRGCRADLLRLERLFLSVESLPRTAAPMRLQRNVMAQVRTVHAARTQRVSGWQRAASSSMIAAALFGLVLTLFSSMSFLSSLEDLDVDLSLDPVGTLLDVAASIELSLIVASALLFVAGTGALMHLLTQHRPVSST